MKRCTKCKQLKDISKYNKDATKKDGLYPSCNNCRSIVGKKRLALFTNVEKKLYNKRGRSYYKNNIEKLTTYEKTHERQKRHRDRERGRKRNFKWIPIINNVFPKDIKIARHHVHDWFFIYIPDITHRRMSGFRYNFSHRNNGDIIIKELLGIDINELLGNTLEGR